MNTIVLYDDSVDIPDGISDLAGFRRWAHSDDFPETGRICFLDGRVWLDVSKEQVFTHNQVKQEFKSFRLSRQLDEAGNPEYSLSARSDLVRPTNPAVRSRRAASITGERHGTCVQAVHSLLMHDPGIGARPDQMTAAPHLTRPELPTTARSHCHLEQYRGFRHEHWMPCTGNRRCSELVRLPRRFCDR